ncbi:putative aldehyde dehydrogenase [Gordonia hirsuta DSM 44140 = NBRC 16056]|uniref:Putative aldehyde dehydrogenase n=1 Tax=Gordonia hirsuta DSM 44140 = NBRC 16056 TaxID=1121927 RepID=L7L8I2_9ACTN|nr:aldehyde dehydrogenase family protein [Gordonia hirsuta]GAC56362.1 putative aldehyde dehydrogenase [Gordonia hirsuta DSM 44140 = NBRC 16056]
MTADAALRFEPTIPDVSLRIGTTRRGAADGATFTSLNPADETVVSELPAGGADDVDAAVAAARETFDSGVWSEMTGAERGRILNRAADLIEADAENLAALEAVEMGKLFRDSVNGDIPVVAGCFRHFAGWADKITGETTPLPSYGPQQRFGYTLRQPLGVVGAITPWNNPAVIAGWKLAPALAAGNTAVIKPAEDASLSTIRLAELLTEAGLPEGVLNVVTGLGEVAGAALAQHPGIDKISFTGSARVGRTINPRAGDKFRKMTLELGGKSPQIVFADADLENSMPWIAMGTFYHQGQVCAAGTRVLVHRSRVDEVVAGLVAAAEAAVIGDPRDEASTMGTIVNSKQLATIERYISLGREEGADLVIGGDRLDRPGYFVTPTVFRGHNDLTIAREEIFGPVATVIPFDTTEEAVAIANDTKYGLNAMLHTTSLATAHAVIPKLRVGMVWVNGWGVPEPSLPWGGREASGYGRELGKSGILANTEEKTVHLAF